ENAPWAIATAGGERASASRIDDLLRDLEGLRAERFVTAPVSDGAPDFTVTVTEGGGAAPRVIRLGPACPNQPHEVLVRGEAMPGGAVGCTRDGIVTTLARSADEWRERHALVAREDEVQEIEIAGGGTKIALRRDGEG